LCIKYNPFHAMYFGTSFCTSILLYMKYIKRKENMKKLSVILLKMCFCIE
jgi:hypothetical protein